MTATVRVARDALRFNLVFRRAKLRLSQAALAEKAAISRPLVSDIEHGRANITLDILERLADALETTAPKLLTSSRRENSDANIAARRLDPPDAFVDGRDFLAALAENNESVAPPASPPQTLTPGT